MSLANSIFLYNIYFSLMKKLITILYLLPSMFINAQVIDWDNFNEKTMNEVMFSQMNDYTKSNGFYSIIRMSVGQQKIYRCIKKNNEKLPMDGLNARINVKVLRKYDSKIISRTNLVGNVGLLDSISGKNIKTYEDIAIRCITDWTNSENIIFTMWSQTGEAITFYNKKTGTVYLFFAFLI
jgi:hypothetical protein